MIIKEFFNVHFFELSNKALYALKFDDNINR